MKQSLRADTLAFQLGVRPALQFRNMSAVPLSTVVDSLNTYMKDSDASMTHLIGVQVAEKIKGSPERDALMFYLLNHAVSVVRQRKHLYEPLGEYLPILDAYHWNLSARSVRMFFYMLLICTRESRHEKHSPSDPYWLAMKAKYGSYVSELFSNIRHQSSEGAASTFRSSKPQMPIGQYVEYLCEVFHTGNYQSGYGGKAWGNVADVLRDFVVGKITAEMMMDTAFTLCHNNGPIFNKGMLYENYSGDIYKILDVQRSGQIPQLIASHEVSLGSDGSVLSAWDMCRGILGSSFEGHVDWFLVEELGALKSYKNQKDAQVAKHGYPSKFKAKLEVEKIKQKQQAIKESKEASGWVTIMPGLKVKLTEVRP